MPAPPKKTANEIEPRRSTRSYAKNAETPSPPSKETATAKSEPSYIAIGNLTHSPFFSASEKEEA